MAINCGAAERGALIKKRREKKFMLKLKAFQTNGWRPNK